MRWGERDAVDIQRGMIYVVVINDDLNDKIKEC